MSIINGLNTLALSTGQSVLVAGSSCGIGIPKRDNEIFNLFVSK